jgi:hypothetical protein
MHAHSNILQVKLELVSLGLVVPIAGLVASLILWLRLLGKGRGNGFSEPYIGFRLIALSFGAWLIWLWLTAVGGHHDAGFTALVLILLTGCGAVAACSGFVLTTLEVRGPLRITGAMLSLVALAYAVASGLALLTGTVG